MILQRFEQSDSEFQYSLYRKGEALSPINQTDIDCKSNIESFILEREVELDQQREALFYEIEEMHLQLEAKSLLYDEKPLDPYLIGKNSEKQNGFLSQCKEWIGSKVFRRNTDEQHRNKQLPPP